MKTAKTIGMITIAFWKKKDKVEQSFTQKTTFYNELDKKDFVIINGGKNE